MNLFNVIACLPRRALRVVGVLLLLGLLVLPAQTRAFVAERYRGFEAQIVQTFERLVPKEFRGKSGPRRASPTLTTTLGRA